MAERVVLTEEKDMYVILIYNSQPKPLLKTCFVYIRKPKEEVLEDARVWAEKISKIKGIPLEEKLEMLEIIPN